MPILSPQPSPMRNPFQERTVLFVVLSLVFRGDFTKTAVGSQSPRANPNVIILMVDDLDIRTLSVLLKSGYMKNLKRHIIDRGVTFENSFASNPICCSSRATFLSGQYSHNHGVLSVNRPPIITRLGDGTIKKQKRSGLSYWTDKNGESNTLMTWLQSAGYTTGHIGKYLNGYGNRATGETYVPPGYDDWNGLVGASTYSMYNYKINQNGLVYSRGDKTSDYQTDVLAEIAKGFIAKVSSSRSQKPFALTLMPVAPHIEMDYETNSGTFGGSIRPAPRHLALVDGKLRNGELPEPELKESVFERDVSDKHPNLGKGERVTDSDAVAIRKQFKDRMAAMLAVDDLIGTVAKALKVHGKYDNTVILFTSDNGWFYGEHGLSGKQWAYDESVRVPLIIASPYHQNPGVSLAAVLNTDLAPTIAKLTGAIPGLIVDGRSLTPLLHHPSRSDWSRKQVFIENYLAGFSKRESATPTYAAIRKINSQQDSLYVHYFSDAESLSGEHTFSEYYQMKSDPEQVQGRALNSTTQLDLEFSVLNFAKCQGQVCRTLEDQRLPAGNFKVAEGLYFADGDNHYCSYSSWSQFLWRNGISRHLPFPMELYPVSRSSIPISNTYDGDCGIPAGRFRNSGSLFRSNGQNQYCFLRKTRPGDEVVFYLSVIPATYVGRCH